MIKCRERYRGLPKSINDAGMNKFHNHLSYTAVEVGKKVEVVDPRNTSKRCFECKKIKKKLELSERMFVCLNCGNQDDRDTNAAKNILYCARLKTFGAGTVFDRQEHGWKQPLC